MNFFNKFLVHEANLNLIITHGMNRLPNNVPSQWCNTAWNTMRIYIYKCLNNHKLHYLNSRRIKRVGHHLWNIIAPAKSQLLPDKTYQRFRRMLLLLDSEETLKKINWIEKWSIILILFFFLQRNGNYQMARVRENKEITT